MPCLRIPFALAALAFLPTALPAAEQPLRALIDAEVRAVQQREKITPPALAADAAFLRRIFLDLLGTIPTHDEVKSFLADTAADKRAKLIDKLLDDPRYAAHQADVWDLVLFGRNPPGYDATRNRDGFRAWLTGKFARNEPYDRWVRALLLAEEDDSTIFYVQYRNQPEETAVAVSRIFLGTQLQCARCHDHPYEPWTQRDFYGMAAFFARLVVVDPGGQSGKGRYRIGEKSTGDVLFTGSAKEVKPGQKGEPIRPKFLRGAALEEPAVPKDVKEPKPEAGKAPPKPAFSRKEKLVDWVVAPDNPYLAKAAVNRVWAQFLGRGLVNPVDDLSDKHAPSHPRLFEALVEGFKAHKYDMKWLIRELVSSETYQAAGSGAVKEALPYWFERARVRPLSAEEMLAAVQVATGFDRLGEKVGGDTKAYIERYFGEPTDGRSEFQATLGEHLFLNNSEQLRRMILPRKGNLADTLLKSKESPEERVDRLFLSVLGRPPRPEERKRFVAHLATPGARPEALVEEAVWALLNTAEFRFNH
jgi:hypothetical protein